MASVFIFLAASHQFLGHFFQVTLNGKAVLLYPHHLPLYERLWFIMDVQSLEFKCHRDLVFEVGSIITLIY